MVYIKPLLVTLSLDIVEQDRTGMPLHHCTICDNDMDLQELEQHVKTCGKPVINCNPMDTTTHLNEVTVTTTSTTTRTSAATNTATNITPSTETTTNLSSVVTRTTTPIDPIEDEAELDFPYEAEFEACQVFNAFCHC